MAIGAGQVAPWKINYLTLADPSNRRSPASRLLKFEISSEIDYKI